MRDIRYLKSTGNAYTLEIDGKCVVLNTAMNKIRYGDIEGMNDYLDRLEAKLASGEPLAELRPIITGTNMLRILGTLYREQTLKNWKAVLENCPERSGKASFESYFGYVHNLPNCPSEFAEELYSMAYDRRSNYIKEMRAKKIEVEKAGDIRKAKLDRAAGYASRVAALERQNRAMSNNWYVERRRIDGNVVVYAINGTEVEICLVGRLDFNYAFNVIAFLDDMDSALKKKDLRAMIGLIKKSGGKAALDIMGKFFHDRSLKFFTSEQERLVHNDRLYPEPSKLLKKFFGGSHLTQQALGQELLDVLEASIPEHEKYLIESSNNELFSDKLVWRLFYYNFNHLNHVEIIFPENTLLREQMQKYCRKVAEPYISAQKPYVHQLRSINIAIIRLLTYVDNKSFTSILDLSYWDFASMTSMMLQNGYSITTIKKDLILIKCFIRFLDPAKADKIIPAKLIPSPMLNPTEPLDPIVFSKVKMYKDEIPEYLWLAFRVFEETAGRSTSIFNLTVDCLIRVGDHWALKLYNYKEEEINARSGIPNIVLQQISADLGNGLDGYIEKTKDLRQQISDNHIFIYESNTFREGSKRRPMVLTPNAFNDFFSRFCVEKNITNSEGVVQAPTARNIRAEVGRSMFANGATADAVSRKLNNTAPIAALHYDSAYPADEAKKRRDLYAETLDHKFGVAEPDESNIITLNTPMYGRCENTEKCGNCNNCQNCDKRTIEKKKERA